MQTINYILILTMLLFCACEDENVEGDFVTTEIFPFSITLEKNTDQYGMWLEIMDQANLRASLNSYGSYTFFVPNNKAVKEWLGNRSIEDISKEEAIVLVRNHVIEDEFISVDFREGTIQNTNLNGDYVAVSFGDNGFNTIQLNHYTTVVNKDVDVLNGIMHGIDAVLVPLQKTLYDYIIENDEISIFRQALEEIDFIDNLKTVSFQNQYDETTRKYSTILAVSDKTFAEFGINSYKEFKDKYSDTDDVTKGNNGLNKWVRYHILYGVYFTNLMLNYNEMANAVNLESYTIGEGVQITESRGSIRINHAEYIENEVVQERHTEIFKNQRNIPLKNGCVHFVNDLMDIIPITAAWVDFDPAKVTNTDVLPHYGPNNGNDWTIDEVEPGEIEEWKWETFPEQSNMRYVVINGWMHNAGAVWFDIGTNEGGWFEVESPLVAKGKYKIQCYDRRWPGGGTFNIYIDGKYVNTIDQYYGAGSIIGAPYWINGITFEDTRRHTIRIEYKEGNPGFIFGRVSFQPI